MEKIAENVTVFVNTHFGKQRPFEIVEGKMLKNPQFPNKESRTIPGVLAEEDFLPEKRRGLFVEGNMFRAGVYYGSVYRILLKDKYYLFRVERDPSKTMRIVFSPTTITHDMALLIESPGGRTSRIVVKRAGNIEADIDLLHTKIRALKGCFQEINDLASEDVENYVRTYYLMEKINKIGGKR